MSLGLQVLPHATDVQYFLEVATHLNISRAAERLGISQPTLSLAIQRLEEILKVQLLLRSKSGVRLTSAGARFASQGKIWLEQWDLLRSETQLEETAVRGRVRIGCHASVALYSMVPVLPDLLASYPDLEISLTHDLSRKITERVISFELDLGIVVNPVEHPDLVLLRLCEDVVTFWHSEDKRNRDVLICDPEIQQTQILLRKAKRAGLEFGRVIFSSNLEVIASLVASGAGCGILPARVAERVPSWNLQMFSQKALTYEDRIFLIYRRDGGRSLAARTIINAVRSEFKK